MRKCSDIILIVVNNNNLVLLRISIGWNLVNKIKEYSLGVSLAFPTAALAQVGGCSFTVFFIS